MSSNGTSSPSDSATRLYFIRARLPLRNWRNLGLRSSVAAYRPTGIVTSPNEMTPFQMGRMDAPLSRSGMLLGGAIGPGTWDLGRWTSDGWSDWRLAIGARDALASGSAVGRPPLPSSRARHRSADPHPRRGRGADRSAQPRGVRDDHGAADRVRVLGASRPLLRVVVPPPSGGCAWRRVPALLRPPPVPVLGSEQSGVPGGGAPGGDPLRARRAPLRLGIPYPGAVAQVPAVRDRARRHDPDPVHRVVLARLPGQVPLLSPGRSGRMELLGLGAVLRAAVPRPGDLLSRVHPLRALPPARLP